MVFSPSKQTNYIIDTNFKINDTDISQVYSAKFLGVIIDSKLNWAEHIYMVKTKIS